MGNQGKITVVWFKTGDCLMRKTVKRIQTPAIDESLRVSSFLGRLNN